MYIHYRNQLHRLQPRFLVLRKRTEAQKLGDNPNAKELRDCEDLTGFGYVPETNVAWASAYIESMRSYWLGE